MSSAQIEAARQQRELLPDLEEHLFEIYGRVAQTGEPIRFAEGSAAMGRWFDVFAFRVGDSSAAEEERQHAATILRTAEQM